MPLAWPDGMGGTPGFERHVLDALPQLHGAVVVPSLVIALTARDDMVPILAIGVAIAWGMLLIPLALACMIVVVLKGPVRTADAYPLPDAEFPRGKDADDRAPRP